MACKKNLSGALPCKPAPLPKPDDDDAPAWVRLHELRINEVAHRNSSPNWSRLNNHLVIKVEGLYNSVAAEIKMPFVPEAADDLRKMFNHDVELIIVRKGTKVIFK